MVIRERRSTSTTASRILDIAEALVQRQGFNGFSYADVAQALGVTTASLHYHFPGKAELGRALISRYAERFFASLSEIEQAHEDATDRIEAYVEIYGGVVRDGRMCLCGMLAAEYNTLPAPMQEAIRAFFDANEAWVAAMLSQGRAKGQLAFEGGPSDAARMLIGALEGAMLVVRPYGTEDRFRAAARQLLANFRRLPVER